MRGFKEFKSNDYIWFKEFKSNDYIWFKCLRKIHRTEKRKTISYIVGVVECFLTDEMITMMGDGKPH